MKLSRDLCKKMYITMCTIRRFEETAFRLYTTGRLAGVMHFAIGQEAVSVGATACLLESDYITSTHRGHGDVIAKGAAPDRMFAELMGKKTGYCKGKGGSLHIMDFKKGILGANGIVAAGVPIAAGAALSIKLRKLENVVICFMGDGAVANASFHEAMNMASLWKLPIIVVRENNQYAESTPLANYQGIPNVAEWVHGYGIPSVEVDGNNVLEVYETVSNFVKAARDGHGPAFVDCSTYRWMGHNVGDPMAYRPKGELEKWKEKDPIRNFRKILTDDYDINKASLDQFDEDVEKLINEAVFFAENSPEIEAEDAIKDIYMSE